MADPLNKLPSEDINKHIASSQGVGTNGIPSEQELNTHEVAAPKLTPSLREDASPDAVALAEQDLRTALAQRAPEQPSEFKPVDYTPESKTFIKLEKLSQRKQDIALEQKKASLRARANLDPRAAQAYEKELARTLTPSQYAATADTPEEASRKYDVALATQGQTLAEQQQNAESRLVDPTERGSILGELKAGALNLGSGITRVGTGIVTAIPTIVKEVGALTSKADSEDFKRVAKITAEGYEPTQEDLDFLKSKEGRDVVNYLDREAFIQLLKTPEKFTQNRLPSANRELVMSNLNDLWANNEEAMLADIENGDITSFLGTIASIGFDGFSALLGEPSVLADSIVETLPDVALAARSMSVALAGTMTQQQQAALEEYIAKYDEMPTGDTRAKLNGYAALAGVMDLAGDKFVVDAMRLIPSSGRFNKITNSYAANILKGSAGEFVASGSSGALMGKAVDDEYDLARGFEGGITGAASAGVQVGVGAVPAATKRIKDKAVSALSTDEAPATGESQTVEQVVTEPVVVKDTARQEAVTQGQAEIQKEFANLQTVKAEWDAEPDNISRQVDLYSAITDYVVKANEVAENTPELRGALDGDTLAPKLIEEFELDAEVVKTVDLYKAAIQGLKDRGLSDTEVQSKLSESLGETFKEGIDFSKVLKDMANVALYSKDLSVEATQDVLDLGTELNAFTPQEIDGLKEVIQRKTIADVSADIDTGTDDLFTGAKTHLANIKDAVSKGASFDKPLARLNYIADYQKGKAQWLQDAIKQQQSTPEDQQTPITNPAYPTLTVGTGAYGINSASKLLKGVLTDVGKIDAALVEARQVVQTPQQNAVEVPNDTAVETPTPVTAEPVVQVEAQVPTPETPVFKLEDVYPKPESVSDDVWESINNKIAAKPVNDTVSVIDDVYNDLLDDASYQENYPHEFTKEELQQTKNELNAIEQVQGVTNQDEKTAPASTPAHIQSVFDNMVRNVPVSTSQDETAVRENRIKGNFVKETYKYVSTGLSKVGSLYGRMFKGENALELYKEAGIDVSKANSADAQLVRELMPLRVKFNKALRSIAVKDKSVQKYLKSREYGYKNPLLLFTDANGNIPRVIEDAMFTAAMQYVLGDGSSDVNDTNTMLRYLGVNRADRDDITPSDSIISTLQEAGTPLTDLIPNLGKNALALSGFRPSANTSTSDASGLEMSLGSTIVNTLLSSELGIFERLDIPASTFANIRTELNSEYSLTLPIPPVKYNASGKEVTTFPYIKLNEDISPELINAFEVSQRATGLFDRLADRDNQQSKAYIGLPPEPMQKGAKVLRSNQQVPAAAIEAHNKAIETKFYLNEGMATLFNRLPVDLFKRAHGWLDLSNTDLVHPVYKITQEGKNTTVDVAIEELETLYSKVDGDLSTPIYYDYNYVSTGRHHMKGTATPQSDKLIRYMTGLAPIEVNLEANTPSNKAFHLAMAQSLGVPTDKISNEDALKVIGNILNAEPNETSSTGELTQGALVVRAISELVNVFDDASYTADADIILRAVESSGEGVHSLKALSEYARYTLAKLNGQSSFDTDITIENDGVTNGPFNATLMHGANELEGDLGLINKLIRGGYTYGADSPIGHNVNKGTTDLKDTYEAVADKAESAMASVLLRLNEESVSPDWRVANKAKDKLNAANALSSLGVNKLSINKDTGAITFGRNVAKNPVTVTIYGGGKKGISDKMAKAYEDHFYDKLQDMLDALNTGVDIEPKLNELVTLIDTYSDATYGYVSKNVNNKLPVAAELRNALVKGTSREGLINTIKQTRLTPTQVKVMQANVGSTVGMALNAAIASEFGVLKERGALINVATNVAHELFIDVFNKEYVKRQKELVAAGELHKSQRLTRKQYNTFLNDIRKFMPIVATDLSTNLTDGFMPSKENMVEQGFDGEDAIATFQGIGSSRALVPSRVSFEAPGVRATPMLVINTDASMQVRNHLMNEHSASLNVFDATINTLDSVAAKGKTLNVASLIAVKDNNILFNVGMMLNRVINNHPVLGDSTLSEGEKGVILLETLKKVQGIGALFNDYNFDIEQINPVQFINTLKNDLMEQGKFTQALKEQVLANGSYDQMNGIGSPVLIKDGKLDNVPQDSATNRMYVDSAATSTSRPKVNKNSTPELKPISYEAAFNSVLGGPVSLFADSTGSVSIDALKVFVKNSYYSGESLLMINTALDRYPDLQVRLGRDLKDSTGTKVKGLFKVVKGVPYIYLDKSYDDINNTLLHELNHLSAKHGLVQGIADFMAKNKTLLSKNVAVQLKYLSDFRTKYENTDIGNIPEFAEIFRLHQQYLDTPSAGTLYAVLQEHIAYGMSDTAVRTVLQKTQLAASDKQSNTIIGFITKTLQTIAIFIGNGFSNVKIDNYYQVLVATATTYSGYTGDSINITTPELNAKDMSASSIFDKLIKGDSARSNELRKMVSHLDTALLNPIMSKYKSATKVRDDHEQAFLDSIDPSVRVKVNQMMSAGFRMSSEESLVYKLQSVALENAFENKYYSSLEAKRLFLAAKKSLKPEDFLPSGLTAAAKPSQLRIARAKYDSIFNSRNNPSGYLANFMALAMVSPEMQGVLAKVNTPAKIVKQVTSDTLPSKIVALYEKVINALSNKVTSINAGDTLDKNIQNLAKSITAIKARKNNLANAIFDIQNRVESVLNDQFKSKLNSITMAMYNKKGDGLINKSISLTGAGFNALVNDNTLETLKRSMNDLVASFGTGRMNLGTELINSVLGQTRATTRALDTLRRRKVSAADAARQNIHDEVPKIIRSKFSSLSDDESVVITKVLLDTDINALVTAGFNMNQIQQMLSDSQVLEDALNDTIAKFDAMPVNVKVRNFMYNEATLLGKRLVTGETYTALNLPNAAAIVNLVGTPYQNKLSEGVQAKLLPLVDAMASLSALTHVSQTDKDLISNIILRETEANGASNGITYVLKKQKSLITAEYARHGEAVKWVMPKGFTHEMTNPHKSVTYDTREYSLDMANKGYSQHSALDMDKADPSTTKKFIYISEEGGVPNWVQTTMSTIETTLGNTSKGLPKDNSLPAVFGYKATNMLKSKRSDILSLFNSRLPYNVGSVASMVPTLDKMGNITSFNYKLNNAQKDNLLERNNDMATLLGAWTARIHEEKTAVAFNKELVNTLHDHWKVAKGTVDAKKFIKVYKGATDKVVADAWKMMPEAMKLDANRIFGGDFIMVDRRDFNNAFGYREWTLNNVFGEDSGLPKSLNNTIAYVLKAMLGRKAFNRVRYMERFLQETVKELKDFIVIRSVIVPVGNMVSNIIQLYLRGVPVPTIKDNMVKGLNAAKEYKGILSSITLMEEVYKVGQYDGTSYNEVVDELTRLRQDLKNNPVHKMVVAGLMPSIVEDLSNIEGSYTIKESLLERISPKIDDLISNPIAKELLVSPSSGTYRAMEELTALGDFVSRFTLYNHYTTKADPMSSELALEKVAYDFIDYGSPDSIAMDYLNKTGLLHFTKWFLRIQPIILSMVRNNPARALSFVAGQSLSGMEVTSPFDAYLPDTDIGNKTGIGDLLSMGTFSQPVFQAL